MFRQSVNLRGVRTTLTTGATLTLSIQIAAPTTGRICVTQIARNHHVSQSNQSIITLLGGTTRLWRAATSTPNKSTYAFPYPLVAPDKAAVTLNITASLNTHTVVGMIYYFIDED